MTRRGIALGCLVWALLMSLPGLALFLFANNEIAWRRGPNNVEVDRLFLINEPDYAGLGFENARIAASRPDGVCVATTLSYLLWRNAEGANPNTSYCQCLDAQGLATESCP